MSCRSCYVGDVSLDGYDPHDFPPFAVTVDLVVLTVRPPATEILLVRRGEEPERGSWSLPGGFVGPDQDLLAAAEGKLTNKTGITIDRAHLEQLETFGAPDRDPRMRVVSVTHLAMVSEPDAPATDEAAWHNVTALGGTAFGGTAFEGTALAFDHAEIVAAGLERARAKLEYTTLATSFCGAEFTIGELRSVYEAVWGVGLDPANFHRKVMATDGFVQPTGRTESVGRGRPARTYVAGGATELYPPIARTSS